ncbi:hypothetical protein SAMN06296241_2561 [Salinimicrobium sediminis]|uniref:Potassium transporter KefB n=1 Tax=Salinimicrobium sediminis TaxID=1343891 RepID=A0A285X6L9_9FLAO|nr:potassium transporter KefB [Salinimicrobium sediminis]SOC80991.1 hypothetical protein SAMN06296241_2561 [Salinimicrobium sediminis]
MDHKNEFTSQVGFDATLAKRMLIGAGIALVFIAIFLFGATPKPEWSPYWILRPFIIVPLAGAFGGAFYHFMGIPRSRGGLVKALSILFSFIGYVVIVWLGTVLGFDGTFFD